MQNSEPAWSRLAPMVLASGLLAVYLATMAPGLTWANAGSDGGDLIAAAATGGVAHPTGYPVYLLLARLFQLLPIGSLAFRTNLLSAVSMVGAALFVSATVKRSLASLPLWESTMASSLAALAFGLSPLAWSQAVITEVYGLHILFISMLLYLSTSWPPDSQIKNWIVGLVQGLAICNHVLAILVMPAVVATVSLRRRRIFQAESAAWREWQWDWHSCVGLAGGIMVGLLIYIILPLRAQAYPAINWGNPVTLDRLAWLVSGRIYYGSLLPFDPSSLWQQLEVGAGVTLAQFGIPGLAVALVGLIVFFSRLRIYFLTIWTALVYTVFYLLYPVTDSIVYLMPLYLAMAIGIGLGLGQLGSLVSRQAPWARAVVGPVCLIYLVVLASGNWSSIDASHDQRAETFGVKIMAIAPPGAILFADGDRTIFTLWYFHYALHQRPDLVVIATDMLPFDWYRENLRHVYPDLVLAQSASGLWLPGILQANPGRRACFPTDLDGSLNCL